MLPIGVVSREKRSKANGIARDCDTLNNALNYSQVQLEESLIKDMVLLEKEYKIAPEALKAYSLVPGTCFTPIM